MIRVPAEVQIAPGQQVQLQIVNGDEQKRESQVEHLINEHVDTSSSYHHDLGEGQETLELSVVTLEGVGVGVGGHHFQVSLMILHVKSTIQKLLLFYSVLKL